VKSLAEAIDWAKSLPVMPTSTGEDTEIEVREFIDFE
jgi:hypothetical protein